MTDKPVTGNGEPKCEHSVGVWWKDRPNEVLCSNCNQSVSLPTPPASQPTVTLDRETFDKVCAVMAKSGMLGNYAIYSNEDGDSHHHGPKRAREYHDKQLALEQEFRDALALLRAAEQK